MLPAASYSSEPTRYQPGLITGYSLGYICLFSTCYSTLAALYSLSALAVLISGGGLLLGTYGTRFEDGAGYAGSFAFLVGALFPLAVAILLYTHWNTLAL
ncbi:hypothetical protein [Spirosoma fluminis]